MGKNDYDNRFKFLHPTGDRDEAYDPGYRVRSMKTWGNGNDCPPHARDKGRRLPQTLLRENVYVHQANGTKGKEGDRDRDKDGLVDRVENELAQAFRPIYVNHSTEDATRIQVYKDVNGHEVMEPITLFQVHPAGEGEIIIRYVRLWLCDRAETTFGCGGHKGDSQRHSIIL